MTRGKGSPAFQYYAFISYSHQDKTWADWLHKTLETYAVPKRLVGQATATGVIPRRLTPIFRDCDELATAHDLGRKVDEALAQSANLIVICSPRSAVSQWVQGEVLAYKRLGRSERIFCLIVDGEPNASDLPGRETEECFAPALRFDLDTSGQPANQHAEPIAADAREGKDGKGNAKLKLIAGMLDVGFDALKQRELRRRARRMTAVAALALVVMVVTSVLAIAALISRHDAVIAQQKAVVAQKAAVVAQKAAERRQKQAENLVGFMLGDLNTRLRQVDQLNILSSLDDKAIAYFKSLPLTDVNATTLAQRAKALQKIGDVRTNQSRLSDALDAFEQALRLNQRLVVLSPKDPARQNALGENLLWIGFNYWNQGKPDRAEDYFTQAMAALQRAIALAPTDAKVQQNLALAHLDLGQVAQARGELDAAHAHYLEYLGISTRMAKADPADIQWRNFIANAYADLGALALTRGQLDEALQDDRDNLRLMAEVVARDPNNRQMQGDLLTSNAILGRTLAFTGNTTAGIRHVQTAVNMAATLIAFDPTHTDWQDTHAYYSRLLGHLWLEQGKFDAAATAIQSSMATLEKLVTQDPANSDWRSDLAEAQLEAATLAGARHQSSSAIALAGQARGNLEKLLGRPSPAAESIRIQARMELLLGQLAADAGNAKAAATYRHLATTHLQPLAANSADPRNLSLWAEALLATGDLTQAQPAIETLRKMGYRPSDFIAQLRDHRIDYPEDTAMGGRIARITSSSVTHPASREHPPQ